MVRSITVSGITLMLALGISEVGEVIAQQAPATTSTEQSSKPTSSGEIATQERNTMLVKEFIGLPVFGSDRAKIGIVTDLILNGDGTAVAGFVVGVGGFLGIGEKSVALKMDQLEIQHNGDGSVQLMVEVTKDDLANAPAFKTKKD